ncbi:MAG: copper amine oxidase N-terminal domain-containing protein [Firmicutes bacterium]|nr:copper amine oxidase N-terminal domain-containing protein [Bacillota bacterium]
MKKKIFVLASILLISLLCTAGSAMGTMHGFFENHPIIKLFINDEEVEPDVPAVNLNGRTMVPLRFIGEELGLEFRFNPEEYAVYVDIPEQSKLEPVDKGMVSVVDYLQNRYGRWIIGGRTIDFTVALDDEYRGSDDVKVFFQIEREDYINWREIKRLYEEEMIKEIKSIIAYLEEEYPQSGISLFVILQTYHDSYDQLAEIVDLKEVTVTSSGQFVIEETLASAFAWPGAAQPRIKIE